MKKFRFKLQRLLEIKEAAVKEVKNELAKLIAVQNKERSFQIELKNSIEDHRIKFQERMRNGYYNVSDAMFFEKFMDISYRAIETAENRIEDMEPGIKEVRDRLVIASKDKKVVEKLKERKLKEYNYQLDIEIAKENDDINQKIYLRKKLEQL